MGTAVSIFETIMSPDALFFLKVLLVNQNYLIAQEHTSTSCLIHILETVNRLFLTDPLVF